MEPLPFPCHPACPGVPWDRSEAERRDLRFPGPFVEMFFDRAYPDVLPHRTGQGQYVPFFKEGA
jgi:hypothetical protein